MEDATNKMRTEREEVLGDMEELQQIRNQGSVREDQRGHDPAGSY